jgi:hypothetical protein
MLLQLASKLGLLLVTTFYDNNYSEIDTFTLLDANGDVVFETNVYGRCQMFLLDLQKKQLEEWASK